MATRSLILTLEERRFLNQLVARAWAEVDTQRLLARIDSPQEKAALADQQFIEGIQAKLRESE